MLMPTSSTRNRDLNAELHNKLRSFSQAMYSRFADVACPFLWAEYEELMDDNDAYSAYVLQLERMYAHFLSELIEPPITYKTDWCVATSKLTNMLRPPSNEYGDEIEERLAGLAIAVAQHYSITNIHITGKILEHRRS